MAVSQVSFSKTPQAKGDFFASSVTEDRLSTILDVMGNDLGGNAKSLYSLGNGSNERDLLVRDTARSSATSGDFSAQGARIWITADGKIGYDATFVGLKFQSLAVGQFLDDTFSYAVELGNGTISTAKVTVRIVGVNDGPQVTSVTQSGAATEDDSLSATGRVTATDVDNGDHQHYSVSGSANGLYGSFGVDAATGQWTYALANGAANVQALAQGESHTETFVVRVTDDYGAYAEQSVSVKVSGTNDGPRITSPDQAGATKEDVVLGATGRVGASDVDNGDHQHYSVSGSAAGVFGSFSIDASTGQWAYALANGAANVQALAQDESHTETFVVRVTDDFGATADQTVRIKVSGTNDGPRITSPAQSGAVTEDIISGATGKVSASDVDNGDHQHFAIQGISVGTYGAVSVNAGSGQWAYALSNDAVAQALAQGESQTDTFSVRVTDDFGASADQSVTLTVTGTNDGPQITSGLQTASVTEDVVLAAGGQVVATDVDHGDHQHYTIQGGTAGVFGVITVTANAGSWNYSLFNSAGVQALAEGENHTDTFTVRVTDDFGATADQLVTVDITGMNDAPVVAGSLSSDTTEDDAPYAINLLALATDVDNNALLHAANLVEVNGKGGWSIDGDNIIITPGTFGEDLNTGQFENLVFSYDIVDEHGAKAAQSLSVSIKGITDAPSLDVVTSIGEHVNELVLTISSEPADTERVGLSFSDVPIGARIYDSANQDVTNGIADYHGTSVFKLILAADHDALDDLTVTATGYKPDGSTLKATARSVDLGYDVAAEGKALTFASEDQNIWGNFPGKIEFHEYLPIVGGAPIYYDATAKEWKSQASNYWHAGEASIVDVRLDSQKVFDTVSQASTAVLGAAKHIFDVTAGAIDAQVQQDFDTAQGVLNTARNEFFYVAHTVDEGVRSVFAEAQRVYYELKGGYDRASYDFNVWATGVHNDEAYRWEQSNQWWNGLSDWDKGLIWNWAPRGADWVRWTAADLAYQGAKGIWDGIKYAFEWTATNTYNAALAVYNTAVGAANEAAVNLWNAAQTTFDAAKKAYEDAKKVVFDAALGIYNTAKDGVLNTIKAVSEKVDFDSQLTVKTDIFAKAGLQVDVVLDLGSADTHLSYDLTSKTQYNKASDVLVITPTVLNKTTGEMVAFDTISPNAKFYIALLHDAGAKFDVLVDGHLNVAGAPIYDFTPGSDQPLNLGVDVSPSGAVNDMKDLLALAGLDPHELDTVDAGKLVLVDFDTTRGDPPLGGFEVPLIGALTEDIVTITLAWPNVSTEGTNTAYNPNFYNEGGLIAVDFSEITDSLFNLVTARLDYSPELRAKIPNLGSLQEADNFDALVRSAITAFTGVLKDVLDGHSEETPIFLLDATDQTDQSLVHVNIFPDDTSTLGANTAKFGFFASYGESNPVVDINIDIDQAIAFVVNEIVKIAIDVATEGAAVEVLEALPTINPADITIGLDTLLKVMQIGKGERETIEKFLDLDINLQAVDVDAKATAAFSQKFSLSIDDMSYLLTLEDGTRSVFNANEANSITITDASSHDANHDGSVAYTMDIVPTAMFSNDTELKLGVGYVLDFLKGGVVANAKLPLNELLGINADWLKVSIPLVDVAVGPLLRVQGDLDAIDIDLFESRFNVNAGSDTFDGSVDVQLAGVDNTVVPAG